MEWNEFDQLAKLDRALVSRHDEIEVGSKPVQKSREVATGCSVALIHLLYY